MKRYEYLLFDADNTLFDFSLAEYISFGETCRAGNLPYSEELYRTYSEINDSLWKRIEKKEITLEFLKTERFRLLLLTMGWADDEATLRKAEELRDTYVETLGQQTCIVDGAEELCKALAGRYKMYLVTNGIGRIQRSRFGKSVLKPYFDGIFISEEMGTAKPEKAYFDHVLREIGSPEREKCLVIGDSLTSDCDGAIASGLDICWYNPKNGDAKNRALTYTVTKLSDIIRLLDESETELD